MLIVCTVAGPLIGMAGLFLFFGVVKVVQEGVVAGLSTFAAIIFPLAWIVAFLVGGIPAFVSGVIYIALDRYAPPVMPRVAAAVALGAAATAMYWMIMRDGREAGGDIASLAALGAVSAGVCSVLTRRWRYRGH